MIKGLAVIRDQLLHSPDRKLTGATSHDLTRFAFPFLKDRFHSLMAIVKTE